MRKIFLISILTIAKLAFAQFPMGKNIKLGEKEIKTYFQTKGFHFLKKEESTLDNKPFYIYKYSEEFKVDLFVNEYENIDGINISTEKLNVINELLEKLDYKKWTFIDEREERALKMRYNYTFKNHKITCIKDHEYKLFQIIVEPLN